MNSNQNLFLIYLREEINEIFFKQVGKRSYNKTGKYIKKKLFEVGKALENFEKEDDLKLKYLSTYIFYLDKYFFKLWESYHENKIQRTDIFQKLEQKRNYNVFEYFLKFGFFCMLFMSKEIQKVIFEEQKFDLFWNELYHFWNEWEFHYEKKQFIRLKEKIAQFENESQFFNLSNLDSFYHKRKLKQFGGRPSKVTLEILMKFAGHLEENRKEKNHTLKEMLEITAENKMEPTTIRNWLRNYMPLLENPKNSIQDLTKDDILFMWQEYEKGKNIIKG